MDVTQVTVAYARTVSDGNFGSERFGAELSAVVGDGERVAEVVNELSEVARGMVTDQLRKARSYTVRHTVTNEDPWPEER